MCMGVMFYEAACMDGYVCPPCLKGTASNSSFNVSICRRRRLSEDSEEGSPPRSWWKERPLPPRGATPKLVLVGMETISGYSGRCPGRPSRGNRDSRCPLECGVVTRKMRYHVVLTHLPPVFRRGVPPSLEASAIRERVLRWLTRTLIGPGASLEELVSTLRAEEVFRDPYCRLTTDMVEAMDSLCRFVGETPPSTYELRGELHPALLFHWRAQAVLLSRLAPDLRATYKYLAASEKVAGIRLRDYSMRMYTSGSFARARFSSRGPGPGNRRSQCPLEPSAEVLQVRKTVSSSSKDTPSSL